MVVFCGGGGFGALLKRWTWYVLCTSVRLTALATAIVYNCSNASCYVTDLVSW